MPGGAGIGGLRFGSGSEPELYLSPPDKKRESLLAAVDMINDKLGDWAIYPAAIDRVKN